MMNDQLSAMESAGNTETASSAYDRIYNPDCLNGISRSLDRVSLGIGTLAPLPFSGVDCWNHYEVSWLDPNGKPMVAIAEIMIDCNTPFLVESKSLKRYFNSLNAMIFPGVAMVEALVSNDLARCINSQAVSVRIMPVHTFHESGDDRIYATLPGTSVDMLEVEDFVYYTEPSLLKTENEYVEETLCSDLLRFNCPVTGQPDWCSVQITYQGNKISREGLLRYLVSFRNENECHEHCIEKIFMQIMQYCKPKQLTVYGRSTRRGGVDINAIRSTLPLRRHMVRNIRLCRQ